MLKRLSDIVLALVGLVVLSLPMLILAAWVKMDSPGPAIFWSQRFGSHSRLFAMPKFRSMRTDTPSLPTHLLTDADSRLTRAGRVLRKFSLDELPQLWSVLIGDMSLVGPRPALHNQDDLMDLRRDAGVDRLRPGITGLAQINGRDELPIPIKVEFEKEYLLRQSFFFDLRIMVLTLTRGSQGVTH